MGDFVLMLHATSLDSVARQYAGRDGHMEEDGANHLSSFRPLAALYECVNPGGLALKKEDLRGINVAKWKELHPHVVKGSFPRRIEVPCIMNGEEQTIVLKNIGGSNGSVEMTLKGVEGRAIPLVKIRNFHELFLRLEREIGLEDMRPEWIDEEGNRKSTVMFHYLPECSDDDDSDHFDNNQKPFDRPAFNNNQQPFAPPDVSKSSESYERSESSTSSEYTKFLDTTRSYEFYASESTESADLFY